MRVKTISKFKPMTSTMETGAIQLAQVIAASGGQPASMTGKCRPRVVTIASTAGLSMPRKASYTRKMPAKPTPSFSASISAGPSLTRANSAMARMTTGSMT
jgi:hypothetical protein